MALEAQVRDFLVQVGRFEIPDRYHNRIVWRVIVLVMVVEVVA